MKTFEILRTVTLWRPEWLTADGLPQIPAQIVPDSAVVRAGFPIFLPQYCSSWHVEIVPTFSICRLGKRVETRFARRYVDGVALMARVVPADGSDVPNGMLRAFDGAIASGSFQPISWDQSLHIACVGSNLNDCSDPLGTDIPFEALHLEETLSLVGRCCTMRTGDWLMPCRTGLTLPATVGLRAAFSLNNTPSLSLKIK